VNAVANAGPLMALAKIGLLRLGPALYQPFLIPAVVYTEVVERGIERGYPGALAVRSAVRACAISVVPIAEGELTDAIRELPSGQGERHAIALALREAADWVLLDDLPARRHAQGLGLHVKGTLGVLVSAYRAGIFSRQECDDALEAILARPDIWISEALVRRVREGL
jgi:predicted nucleic acid-binding protein